MDEVHTEPGKDKEKKKKKDLPADKPGPKRTLAMAEEKIKEQLLKIADGAVDDVAKFVTEIMTDIVIAAQAGRSDLVMSMEGQMRVLAEKHRLKIANAAWSTVIGLFKEAAEIAAEKIAEGSKA